MAITPLPAEVDHRFTCAEFRRIIYFTDGWSRPMFWDGFQTSLPADTDDITAGIAPPTDTQEAWTPSPTDGASSGTGWSTGVHRVRYRYYNPRTGYVSDPSSEAMVNITSSGRKRTFAIDTSGAANIVRSTDAKATRLVVEKTVAGGTQFYKAAEALMSASSVEVDVSDAFLSTQFLPWPETGHLQPPLCKWILAHGGRIWMYGNVVHSAGAVEVTNGSTTVTGNASSNWDRDAFGRSATAPPLAGRRKIRVGTDTRLYEISHSNSATEIILTEAYAGLTQSAANYEIISTNNLIYVSRANFPEAFSSTSFIDLQEGEMAGGITGGVGYGTDVVFFTAHTSFRFIWNSEPSEDGQAYPIPGMRGALSQRVVTVHDGVLYAMDRQGMWAYDGGKPRDISRKIEELITDNVDFSQLERFHCVYWPRTKAIRWYVCYSGDTYPKHYFQYDVEQEIWTTGVVSVGISESRLLRTDDGLRVALGDENGHTWFGDLGTCEGCHEDYSHVTVGNAATAASIPITSPAALPTLGVGLAGCILYWPARDESRVIQSNTSTVITPASAFGAAPSAGTVFWIGQINATLRTKAFAAARGGPANQLSTRYVRIFYRPTDDTRYALVRIYEDYSNTAKTWGSATFRGEVSDNVIFPGRSAWTTLGYATSDWLCNTSSSAGDGMWRIPLYDGAVRHVEVEIEVTESDLPLEIWGIELDGVESEEVAQ